MSLPPVPEDNNRARSVGLLQASQEAQRNLGYKRQSQHSSISPSSRKTSFSSTIFDSPSEAGSTTPFPPLSACTSQITLWDGTVVEKDPDSDEWRFRPNSLYTIASLPYTRRRNSSIWLAKGGEEIPMWFQAQASDDESSIPATKSSDEEPEKKSSPQIINRERMFEVMFVFNVCLAQLFSLAALAQTVAPLPIISDSFHLSDPGRESWFAASYSLTLGTFILPAGRLGDMFGHKKIFMIGWVWFAVWSVVCGFSYTGGPIMLSTFRAMQGIGPALLVPNAIAITARTFPLGMKRNIAMALFGGCGPVGFVLGAVFSSIFAQLVWWPWAFWALGLACFLAAGLSYFVIPQDAIIVSSTEAKEKFSERFDIRGAVTGVSGLILINFALNQAPVVGWQIPYIPVLLASGILLIAAFIYIELKVAGRPIVPLKGLHKDAAFTLACIAAGWGSHGIWIYYLFLLLENIRGYSALGACALIWPVAPIGLCAAVAVPFLLRRVKVPQLMSVAMAFFCIGSILLATSPPQETYWYHVFLAVILTPLAMNWSFPSGTILMSNAVSKKHQGIAASLISTMVNYSISTGLGLAGSIDRYVTPKHGLLAGYRGAWCFGIGLSAIGLMISFYFVWQSRRKP